MNEPTLDTRTPNMFKQPKTVNLPLGESANNVEVKDMSPQITTVAGKLDMNSYLAFYREAKAILERDVVETAFDVVRKEIIVGTQMTDKETKEPIFMSDGTTPRLFADRLYIVVLAKNKELKIKCNKEMYDSVVIGERYLFKGYSDWVTAYGKTDWMTVYTSATPLIPIS